MHLSHLHSARSLAVGLCLFALPLAANSASESWTDSGAEFAAGELGDSGQNLYVNRHGALEVIRRYDLDANGYLDLLFNSTHDIFNALPATMATAAGRTIHRGELAVDGSSAIIPHDLNLDGFMDLVFMPNRQNVQQQRSSIIIAWGAADGWNTSRLTRQLPVESVTRLAVGDLNGDSWPDLLTLNGPGWLHGQPDGNIIRVYWGSRDGYFPTAHHDLGVANAVDIATGRFGRDATAAVVTSTGILHFIGASDGSSPILRITGQAKLPLGSEKSTKVQCLVAEAAPERDGDVLWIGTNTTALVRVATGSSRPKVTTVKASPATHLAVGRLDNDDWVDVVLTDFNPIFPTAGKNPKPQTSVTVLWGTSQEALDTGSPLKLSIANGIATTIGDLNADGRADLLAAVFQGDESQKASSLVFFGDGSRRLAAEGTPVATEGARGVAVARVNPDAKPVAIFANSQHRTLDDAVPLRLYWGAKDGFSTNAMVDIPNLSGYKSSASDLNSDGHVDLIVINGGDISEDAAARAPLTGINIYWGGFEGSIAGPGPTRFDASRRQVLHEKHLGSINVADLNRDGYLDLVLGAFESASRPDTDLVIHYGSAEGFVPAGRRRIPVPGRSIGCLIADYNRDGHLDIIIGSYTTNQVITFWGGENGYSADQRTILPYPAPIDIEAADLNADGWLDLLVASYQDPVAHHHDMGTSLFWGGEAGWHQSRSQWLPGMTPLGLAVADLDLDGHLDIVSPHYHGELSREHLPCYIFWGDADGYAAQRRTALIVHSASEAIIADFDQDGLPDIAFAAHSIDPGHLLDSPVFYNDGERFSAPRTQYLPAVGPHYTWVQDIGNIAHRRHEETFTSRTFTWTEKRGRVRLDVDAVTPFGSKVRIEIRSGSNPAALETSSWRSTFDLSPRDRVMQYRLVLQSANGDAYPIVRRIGIALQ